MKTDIGNRIKKIREIRDCTQAYVAHKLNISQNTYSKIECGHTNIKQERLNAIASILEVPDDVILDTDVQLFNFSASHKKNDDKIAQLEKINGLLESEVQYLRKQNMVLIEKLGNGG